MWAYICKSTMERLNTFFSPLKVPDCPGVRNGKDHKGSRECEVLGLSEGAVDHQSCLDQ